MRAPHPPGYTRFVSVSQKLVIEQLCETKREIKPPTLQQIQSTRANLTTDNFIDSLANERGYFYLQTCLVELPCIDWQDFVSKMYRKNNKASTAIICCRAMYYFVKAYKATKRSCPNDVISKLIASHDRRQALELIDQFVSYCHVQKGLLAGATSVHVRAIKRVLKFAGVKIDNQEFKDNVFMPKPTASIEQIPTNGEIRQILNYATPRVRAALMVMAESGLGRSEVIRLRPKDFDFSKDPCEIRTQRFKTGENFATFCTAETAKVVSQLIATQNTAQDAYVFVKRLGKNAADKFTEAYNDCLKKAGLAQKLEVRLGDKVMAHKYYKFHLHIYRKRWFTKAINVVPAYVAHAMLGRKQYLSQYQVHNDSERAEFYRKIAKHISIFESQADQEAIHKQAESLLGQKISVEQLNTLKDLLRFSTMKDSPLTKILTALKEGEKTFA